MELISWCAYYYNIYSGDKKPDDYTIDNDPLLDRWIEEQEFKKRQENLTSKSGMRSAAQHENVVEFG